MRIAIFGNLIASAICEGIAASFYDAEGNPQPPENAEKMRKNIKHCLDYVEELIDGKYAHHYSTDTETFEENHSG